MHFVVLVTQLCPTLCDPMDCSLPGSLVHGILQARVLEWGAIAFSDEGCYIWLIDYSKSRYIYKQTGILKLMWLIDIIFWFFNKVCRNQLHSTHQNASTYNNQELVVPLAVIYNLQRYKNSSKIIKRQISRICALNKTSGTNFCQFPFVHSHSFSWQSSHLTFIIISNTFYYWSQKNRLLLLGLT